MGIIWNGEFRRSKTVPNFAVAFQDRSGSQGVSVVRLQIPSMTMIVGRFGDKA